MACADGFVRGETLDLLFDFINEDQLDEMFKEDIDVVISEVS